MQIRELNFGGWQVRVGDHTEVFGRRHVEETKSILDIWQTVYPKEDTYVCQEFGVPSLFVRIDCVPDPIRPFEIEERPQGAGLMRQINDDFRQRLDALRAKWPKFVSVISPRREKHGDDHLWLDVVEPSKVNGHLVLARCEPHEEEFHRFAARSVSTIKTEGDKGYGVHFGWWQEVTWNEVSVNPDMLPWKVGFALKPTQGSKCHDVHIVAGEGARKEDGSTRKKVLETLQQRGRMYLQPYIPPKQMIIHNKKHYQIWRVYFGFDPETREWVPLGGAWNARRSLRVHGASDTIFGNVIVADDI